MARGTLRVYLGAAPGVGKTCAMLDEGWRRRQRGADVVIGWVELHGRAGTAERIRDLEVVPARTVPLGGTVLREMDLDAVLVRRPAVALVDELAHANAPGGRHEKRWQDVEALRAAGIDVVTTLNVAHLESLRDVVVELVGTAPEATVPDEVVRRADQVELVDMSPEALRRRLAHGNVYPPDQVDAALANAFRPANLGALRELALVWVADRVEEALQAAAADDGSDAARARERVVVALSGAPGADRLVRRAARMAQRAKGELIGVHVSRADGLAGGTGPDLGAHRALLVELGGRYREIVADDVAGALGSFADAVRATQLVVGASPAGRRRWRGSVVARLLPRAHDVDVHVIAVAGQGRAVRLPAVQRAAAVPRWRRLAAWALTLVGLPLLTLVMVALREETSLSSDLVVFLGLVAAIAGLGGLTVGLVASVGGFLLLNWYFTPPLHTLAVNESEDAVALVAFVAVAIVVSTLVDRAARRAGEAHRARAEAAALARTTGDLLAEDDPRPELVEQVRLGFGLEGVSLLERGDGGWVVHATAGPTAPTRPEDGTVVALDEAGATVLVLSGEPLGADDQLVLRAFTDQFALASERRRLRGGAAAAEQLAQTDALRTALLQAVSHDLRTPLATIKASVTSLLQQDVAWSQADQQALLGNIDSATDRLDRLIGNLLDMSRLQSGALQLACRPVPLEDVVARAVGTLPVGPDRVTIDVSESVPLVSGDPVLLERAVANVVSNALAWSPPGGLVRVEAGAVPGGVDLRVVDRGPGVAPEDRERVFEPFQRRGDRSHDAGVGLGLAVARGFVRAMDGTIDLDDTPGGGLTVTLRLRSATPTTAAPAGARPDVVAPTTPERTLP